MRKVYWTAFFGIALLFLQPMLAQAQATRTWVSGVGDDANPCSRTAPCKTFAGAISKTAAGGEISVLDPGGYGAVTITKAISIINDYSGEAGVLASGTNGVTVNAGANDVVILRGIVIDGAPPATPGLNGIRFLAGASLHVQKCLIKNFVSTAAGAGNGILFAPSSGSSELHVADTTFINNGAAAAAAGGAVQVAPTGSGSAAVSINRVEMQNNRSGLVISTTATSGTVIGSINNITAVGGSAQGVAAVTNAAGGTAATMIVNNSIVSNNNLGASANGNAAVILLGGSILTGNTTATSAQNSGTVSSYKNNLINGNGNNTTPLPAVALN